MGNSIQFVRLALGLGILLPLARAPGAPLTASQRNFFENRIRPVLVKRCYECHAGGAKKLGGKLRLDSREALLTGGESGPALVPGKPEQSLLIQSLHYDGTEMPPDEPLPANVINDFVKWVRMGAPDPRVAPANSAAREVAALAPDDPALWSFQPVGNPAPPAVRQPDWPRDPLDRFVLAGIERNGLTPAADASPRVLAQRLSFDLTGLPASLEQVRAFERDHGRHGQRAVAALVDELLASPHFGERWGRHWLDVARYGESNGNDGLSRNPTFPHAWRYRDYVIQAFNEDLPYDRFLTEQIAGDLLPADSPAHRDRLLVATGFLALGSKPAKAMNNDFDMDVVADQIDVVGSGILGLSVACARCHDHKHDPIPTRDYYALAGIFQSTETLWGRAADEPLTAPETPLHVLKTAFASRPTPADDAIIAAVAARTPDKKKNPPKNKYPPGTPLAMGVRDKAKPADGKVNLNGDSKKPGPVVPRGFLGACRLGGEPAGVDAKQSGRLQLAQWLTRPDHPQTARVLVNRLWLHLFGQPIVRTPDDFGVYGDRPTHPELLDHLATRLVRDGWSVKRMLRAIVLSRAYQLSSQASPAAVAADPDNQWFARHQRRRLDAEALRDRMLVASGDLDPQPARGSVIQNLDLLVNAAGNLHQPSFHRSVYLCLLRNSPPEELAAFDLPDGIGVAGRRAETTQPAQALFLINSPFVVQQSTRFAARLLALPRTTDADRTREAFRRGLAREPGPEELRRALELVEAVDAELISTVPDSDRRREAAWAALCQGLLAANEFRYLD